MLFTAQHRIKFVIFQNLKENYFQINKFFFKGFPAGILQPPFYDYSHPK